MKEFEPTYLCIKQHSITGLKYLCKTQKSYEEMLKYKGSGRPYWNNHLKTHGKESVETPWYCLFTEKEELTKFALTCSEQWDIVKSDEWANLKPENGLDGNPKGKGWAKGTKRGPHSAESNAKRSRKTKGVPKGPQTSQHRANLSAAKQQNGSGGNNGANKGMTFTPRQSLACPYCGKIGKQGNMARYHFDNCLLSPNATPRIKYSKQTCPHCGTVGGGSNNMQRYHFDNCKLKGKK